VNHLKIKNFLLYLFIIFLLTYIVVFVLFGDKFIASSLSALKVFSLTVLPALIPYLTAISFLAFFSEKLINEKSFNKIIKPFNISLLTCYYLLIGALSGYPVGTKSLITGYRNRTISEIEVKKSIYFSSTVSPVLLISCVGKIAFNSIFIGISLYLIHIFSTLILGRIFSKNIGEFFTLTLPKFSENNEIIFPVAKSVLSAAFLSCFLFTVLDFLLPKGSTLNPLLIGLFSGFIDTTFACEYFFAVSSPLSFSLTAFILSLGGLSALAISLYEIKKAKLNARRFLLFKILQALLTFILSLILFVFIF